MPKLNPNENAELKRQQLKEAKELRTFFVSSELDKWTDKEVNNFYDHFVTNDMFEAYERDKAYRKYLDESNRASEANYQQNRPTKENTGHNDRVRAIQFDRNLNVEERNAKIRDEVDRFEHTRIGYELRHNRPVSREEDALFEKLDNKFALEEYDAKGREIERLEKLSDELTGAISKCTVRSLSRWDRFTNRVRKFFGRPESEKALQYNLYESYKEQKKECDDAIRSNSIRRDEIEGNYASALKERDKERAEENRLQKLDKLAKDVVRITKGIEARLDGKDAPELTEEEVAKQAEILKGKEYFKEAIAELDAENSTVEPANIVHKLADKVVAEKAKDQKYMDEAMQMDNLSIADEQMENLNVDAEQAKKPNITNENRFIM